MNSKTASHTALDRSDERVRHDEGLFGALRAQITRIKTGDLGTAPVIAGLIVISLVFTFLNPVYIAPNNLVNLLFDCATVGFISLGIVCVLMLGEIDLSVGSMSGLASAIVGVLWVNAGWPLAGAIAVALACGVAVGLYFLLRPYFGVETLSWVCILGASPFAMLGFITYHGMTAEQFIWAWLRSEMLEPKEIKFEDGNYYYAALKDVIEGRQTGRPVRKQPKEPKQFYKRKEATHD